MLRAVCGFYFSSDLSRVVLVKKERPEWQRGLYNGVGGKVEDGEFARDAMAREFEEETGVRVETWEPFCRHGHEASLFEVTYFRAFGDRVYECRTTTDEEVVLENPARPVSRDLWVANLAWIIPMAMDLKVKNARVTSRDG